MSSPCSPALMRPVTWRVRTASPGWRSAIDAGQSPSGSAGMGSRSSRDRPCRLPPVGPATVRCAAMPTEEPRLDFADDVDGALVLTGEIDSYTAPELSDRLAGDPPVEVLDVGGVTFIDSSGLRVIVEAHQSRLAAGSRLVLRSPSAAVQRLLEISGLAGHLDVAG